MAEMCRPVIDSGKKRELTLFLKDVNRSKTGKPIELRDIILNPQVHVQTIREALRMKVTHDLSLSPSNFLTKPLETFFKLLEQYNHQRHLYTTHKEDLLQVNN